MTESDTGLPGSNGARILPRAPAAPRNRSRLMLSPESTNVPFMWTDLAPANAAEAALKISLADLVSIPLPALVGAGFPASPDAPGSQAAARRTVATTAPTSTRGLRQAVNEVLIS